MTMAYICLLNLGYVFTSIITIAFRSQLFLAGSYFILFILFKFTHNYEVVDNERIEKRNNMC
jgi:hypothetical protein